MKRLNVKCNMLRYSTREKTYTNLISEARAVQHGYTFQAVTMIQRYYHVPIYQVRAYKWQGLNTRRRELVFFFLEKSSTLTH